MQRSYYLRMANNLQKFLQLTPEWLTIRPLAASTFCAEEFLLFPIERSYSSNIPASNILTPSIRYLEHSADGLQKFSPVNIRMAIHNDQAPSSRYARHKSSTQGGAGALRRLFLLLSNRRTLCFCSVLVTRYFLLICHFDCR